MASEREEGGDRGPVCGVPGKCKNNKLIFKYVSGDIKDFLDNLFFWVFPLRGLGGWVETLIGKFLFFSFLKHPQSHPRPHGVANPLLSR